MGKTNQVNDSISSMIVSINNTTTNSESVFVFGDSNKVVDVSGSIIMGKNLDVSGNTKYSLISGLSNSEFNGNQNALFGENHNVQNTTSSMITGDENTEINGTNNFISGNKNVVNDSINTTVKGLSNNVANDNLSLINGKNITDYDQAKQAYSVALFLFRVLPLLHLILS